MAIVCTSQEINMKEVSLRPAVANDALLLFRWRNDDETRRHSGDPKPFSWLDHKDWFLESLLDPTRTLLVGESVGGSLPFPVGTVRLDQTDNSPWPIVSITVDPIMRRMGFGHAMLRKLVERYGDITMIANVRSSNQQSIALFKKCGFRATEGADLGWCIPDEDPEWCLLRREPEPTHFLPLRGSE